MEIACVCSSVHTHTAAFPLFYKLCAEHVFSPDHVKEEEIATAWSKFSLAPEPRPNHSVLGISLCFSQIVRVTLSFPLPVSLSLSLSLSSFFFSLLSFLSTVSLTEPCPMESWSRTTTRPSGRPRWFSTTSTHATARPTGGSSCTASTRPAWR